MSKIDINTLAARLDEWARARYFNDISALGAGWSRWLQTDFAAWLLDRFPKADVQRDVRVLEDEGPGIDLLLNAHAPAAERIAILVLCQTAQDSNFLARADEALNRLAKVAAVAEHRGCSVHLLAGVITEVPSEGLRQRSFTAIHNGNDMHLYMKQVNA